jgi:lipopolysaccharide biosynthesis glycosyltransferase
MNILVTLNGNYIKPLKVMLWSLFFNNPKESFCIYLLHSSISPEGIAELEAFVSINGQKLQVIPVPGDWFTEAPVVKHYSKEMYYRLLAYQVLPPEVERILYLDPDILVINSVRELYDTDISGFLYAASYHDMIPVKGINKIRLKAYELDEYFNSGVLLMNLPLQRERDSRQEIIEYIEKNKNRLILPDQDILNTLYSKEIKKLDEIKYNYDVRHYQYYKFLSDGEMDISYIMRNTSILHFCGKKKPWQSKYAGVFGPLYKHYEILAERREVEQYVWR